MRFFAFIVPRDFTHDKLRLGQVVGKASILALHLAASVGLLSCSERELQHVDPQELVSAADSATRALSGDIAIVRDTARRPSVYFDTLYKYYAQARMLERDKRLDSDSLARYAVLAVDNIKDASSRAHGRAVLNAFLDRDSMRVLQRETVASSLSRALHALLDSTSLDPIERSELVAELSSPKRLEPEWRPALDSLTRETVRTEMLILHFLDTAARRVQIEDVLKFKNESDIAGYRILTDQLSRLAASQQELVESVTYGIPIARTDSMKPPTHAPTPSSQPSASWPRAVRVQ